MKEPQYDFTMDWFSRNELLWLDKQSSLSNITDANILEIGSWDGRSATWLADRLLLGTRAMITCVDLWSDPVAEVHFDANVHKSSLYSGCAFLRMKGRSRNDSL